MKSALTIACLVALSSISATALADKYYKWIDQDGVTHYSETRPANTPTTLIRVKAGTASAENSAMLSAATSTDSSKNVPELENPQPTEQQLKVQRSNCAKASRKLIALENAGRVRQLDEQTGEYRYLPNKEKLEEISKMREYLRSNCRGR